MQSGSCRACRWRAVRFRGSDPGARPRVRGQPHRGRLCLKRALNFKSSVCSLLQASSPWEPSLLCLSQLSLALAEQRCEEWKTQYEALQEDWRTLGDRHRELESQLHVLQCKLQVREGEEGGQQREEGSLEKRCFWAPKVGRMHQAAFKCAPSASGL